MDTDTAVTALKLTPTAEGGVIVALSNGRSVTLTPTDLHVARQAGHDLAAFAVFIQQREDREAAETALVTARQRAMALGVGR